MAAAIDIALPRLTATLIGCGLIVGSLLLWPPVRYRSFWSGVGGCLRNMHQAVADLARMAAAGLPPPAHDPELIQTRRRGRLNLQNADAVVTEIFLEPLAWHPNRRELRSVVDDLQRLTGALVALAGPQRELGPASEGLARSADLISEIAEACSALDTARSAPLPWPDDLPARVRDATAPLDALQDEPLLRFAAALRDLAEDLGTLQRLRVAPAPSAKHDPRSIAGHVGS